METRNEPPTRDLVVSYLNHVLDQRRRRPFMTKLRTEVAPAISHAIGDMLLEAVFVAVVCILGLAALAVWLLDIVVAMVVILAIAVLIVLAWCANFLIVRADRPTDRSGSQDQFAELRFNPTQPKPGQIAVERFPRALPGEVMSHMPEGRSAFPQPVWLVTEVDGKGVNPTITARCVVPAIRRAEPLLRTYKRADSLKPLD